jgi:hypothetical protein
MSTSQTTAIGARASKERHAEITSGRAITQQGLAATCKDPPTKVNTGGGGRVLVWRMRPYERRRRGNALRGGARHHPGRGNTLTGQRASGRLAGLGAVPDTVPGVAVPLKTGLAPHVNHGEEGCMCAST